MNVLDETPSHLLGYNIKSNTRIIFYWILPTCLELLLYIIHITIDIAVAYQHFKENNLLYCILTSVFILLPSVLCFLIITTSCNYWPEINMNGGSLCNYENWKFFLVQVYNTITFPFYAIYRFCRRIFWSIESIFHENNTYERQYNMSKASENSTFELYNFLQAYTQSAPQIILQLYILLREDMFRNYETSNIQVLSVIMSLINMSVITLSYQRFESQKLVGQRYIPWATFQETLLFRNKFYNNNNDYNYDRKSLGKYSNRTSSADEKKTSTYFPSNEHVFRKFQMQHSQNNNSNNNNQDNNNENSVKTDDNENYDEIDISENISNNKNNHNNENNKEKLANSIGLNTTIEEDKLKNLNYVLMASTSSNSDPMIIIHSNVTDDEKLNKCQLEIDSKCIQNMQSIGSENIIKNQYNQLATKNMNLTGILETNIDDVINNENKQLRILLKSSLTSLELIESEIILESDIITPPDEQAPPPPPSQPNIFNFENDVPLRKSLTENTLKRLSTIKDMIVFDTGNYLLNTLPHPPQILADKFGPQASQNRNSKANNEMDPNKMDPNEAVNFDQVDFFLPRKRKALDGIEQDDFIGRVVAFFGWLMFIYMRMLSLSVYSVYYLNDFFYLISGHFLIIFLIILWRQSNEIFKKTFFWIKLKNFIFYLYLSYIYIFVIIEFKIKFNKKTLRYWYVGYLILIIFENLLITFYWYGYYRNEDSLEYYSWSLDYIFISILSSGLLFFLCIFVYYIILKPNDVILIEK